MDIVYERLTDKTIDELSQNRVIKSDGDFNLKRNSKYEKNRLYPVVQGVYDSNYFGSIYTDTCNCGRVHSIGTTCSKCGSKLLTEEEKYKRYARIDLDFYYVMNTKIQALIAFLQDLPLDLSRAKEFFEFTRVSKTSAPKICELCQFDWDDNLQEIIVNPKITNESKSAYEGLLLVLKEHFPSMVDDFLTIVNKKVLVMPAVYRMASFNPYDPVTKLKIPFMSSLYQTVVRLKDMESIKLDPTLGGYSDPSERVAFRALLRRFLAKIPDQLSEALAPSKENIFRNVLSARIDNSGRAPIVGDPKLAIDEVMLPIHLAYEICKIDFIAYIAENLQVAPDKAETIYRRAEPSTIELFKEYSPSRRVIVTRPPSLHRYNNMSFKLLTTEDQAIHFPITSVEPFAADYDGDCMNFYLIPKELNELCDANASPATQLRYESTDDFIWKPNQDMLYGLTLATRLIPNDEDAKAPKYITLADALKDYDTQVIMYPTDHIYMNGKITSLSREVISDIIGKPISDLYGEGYVNAKNLSVLLSYLYSLPNFTEVYQKVVEYALEVLTLEGATVPSLEEMVSIDQSEFTDEMKELIAKAQSDPRYHLELEQKYKEYVESTVKGLSKDLTRRVEDSGRMKMKQITDMIVAQLTVDPKGDYYIATNSLVNGLSYEDYIHHCVNNRTLLQMKQELTPNSGYCNRQLIQAGQGIKMHRGAASGPNEGVWIPRNKAEGRTTLDGEVLDKSDSKELVLVKSFAMSEDGVMTPELLSETSNMFNDQSNVGLKMTSATAGSITQSALSLKHQGTLLELDKHLQLKAKADCVVRKLTQDTIEITETESGKKYNHFIPSDFILANPNGEYKKGEIIGFRDKFTDPGFKGRSMIDLLGALSTEDMSYGNRTPDYSLCVSPVGGVVHYDMEYIHIGNTAIPRNPERVYYYFEGENIAPYTIICDGVLDMRNIPFYCPNNRDYYGCFRTYFLSILPQMNEQTVEYVFTTITTRTAEGRIEYTGVKQKVREDKSVITNIGYEGASRIIPKLLGESAESQETNAEDRDLFYDYYLTLLSGHL